MSFTAHHHRDDHHESGSGTRPSAGKRTLTSRLAPRLGAAATPEAVQLRAAPAAALDDPFALHLLPVQCKVDSVATGDVHAAAARGIAGSAGPLPFVDQIQASFAHHDVSHVRAHVDGAAADASAAMGARAYATGDHIAFAGAPDLHTAAHEAAHVVQQRAGVHLKGGVGAVGDGYEQHADAVADLVVQGKSAAALLDAHAPGRGTTDAIQHKIDAVYPTNRQHQELPEALEDKVIAAFGHALKMGQKQIVLRMLNARRDYTMAEVLAALRAGKFVDRDGDSSDDESGDDVLYSVERKDDKIDFGGHHGGVESKAIVESKAVLQDGPQLPPSSPTHHATTTTTQPSPVHLAGFGTGQLGGDSTPVTPEKRAGSKAARAALLSEIEDFSLEELEDLLGSPDFANEVMLVLTPTDANACRLAVAERLESLRRAEYREAELETKVTAARKSYGKGLRKRQYRELQARVQYALQSAFGDILRSKTFDPNAAGGRPGASSGAKPGALDIVHERGGDASNLNTVGGFVGMADSMQSITAFTDPAGLGFGGLGILTGVATGAVAGHGLVTIESLSFQTPWLEELRKQIRNARGENIFDSTMSVASGALGIASMVAWPLAIVSAGFALAGGAKDLGKNSYRAATSHNLDHDPDALGKLWNYLVEIAVGDPAALETKEVRALLTALGINCMSATSIRGGHGLFLAALNRK